MAATDSSRGSYADEKEAIKSFLQDFVDNNPKDGNAYKYMAAMQDISNRRSTQFRVDVQDIENFKPELARKVQINTFRYLKLFAEVVEENKPPPSIELRDDSVLDVFIQHRAMLEANARAEASAGFIFPFHLLFKKPSFIHLTFFSFFKNITQWLIYLFEFFNLSVY